ncbi:NVEALA domain-containing protein [Xylanibacter muris]|uniref:Uncharacterized protein n=1 Tax=Xylanibacter muris TaxID=2736290 RepID=A0ABX2AN37_9BACT|nr:NVEALA domain-containing protein [Xylanibacter muris]NPD91634.1 hypothetical protein [Xylanibacter muris]
MRRELKFALCAVVLVCSGITGYLSMPKTQESNMLMENVEALANVGEEPCNSINGYRQWKVNGNWFESKKEFYDCCDMKQEGYSPKENCRR